MLNLMIVLLQAVKLINTSGNQIDSVQHVAKTLVTDVTNGQGINKLSILMNQLLNGSVNIGMRIIGAIVIFIVGRFIIKLLNRLVKKVLKDRNIDSSVKGFLESFINILMLTLLLVAVINKLGIETTSFAALLASFGVAVGMALSGNLQNFAGGILILLFRPFKVGDFVGAQGEEGTVISIQIFHTVLRTYKGSQIYMPNGQMSSNKVINFSKEPTRMVEWNIGVDYGEDLQRVEDALNTVIMQDKRIEMSPIPYIAVKELDDSSVILTVRVWAPTEHYAGVLFDGNRRIYDEFNRRNINFPYPQMTIHQVKD